MSYSFSGTPDLVSIDLTTGRPRSGIPATVWDSEVGGTQYLGISDSNGGAGGIVISGVAGRYAFEFTYGNGVPELWLDQGAGMRWLVRARTILSVIESNNKDTIYQQARNAIVANKSYIVSIPTAAQVIAQSKALSRQVNGIIRLLLLQLDEAD